MPTRSGWASAYVQPPSRRPLSAVAQPLHRARRPSASLAPRSCDSPSVRRLDKGRPEPKPAGRTPGDGALGESVTPTPRPAGPTLDIAKSGPQRVRLDLDPTPRASGYAAVGDVQEVSQVQAGRHGELIDPVTEPVTAWRPGVPEAETTVGQEETHLQQRLGREGVGHVRRDSQLHRPAIVGRGQDGERSRRGRGHVRMIGTRRNLDRQPPHESAQTRRRLSSSSQRQRSGESSARYTDDTRMCTRRRCPACPARLFRLSRTYATRRTLR
jgi:hypothetical protein